MKGHFYIIFNQPGKVDWESILTGFVKTVGKGPDMALLPNPVVLVWGRREYRSRQIAHGKIRHSAVGWGESIGWAGGVTGGIYLGLSRKAKTPWGCDL